MQLQIAAKPSDLCWYLENTNEELDRLATTISPLPDHTDRNYTLSEVHRIAKNPATISRNFLIKSANCFMPNYTTHGRTRTAYL